MVTRKQKNLDTFNAKRNHRRTKASNRFFLDQDTMGEARWEEAVQHSRAKKDGKKLVGVQMGVFNCPCACLSSLPKFETGDVKFLRHSKSQRPPASKPVRHCVHFGGKAI